MSKAKSLSVVPHERIDRSIYLIRGAKVLLDTDLAALYGVSVGRLNEAVKRNRNRFPQDFMFQLTRDEHTALLSQSAIAKKRGGRRTPPFAFTEQGVAMLSTVLSSERAVQVSIEIMRAFVRLRRMLESNAELARRLDELESKYDEQFGVIFDAIRQLMESPDETPDRPPIGYHTEGDPKLPAATTELKVTFSKPMQPGNFSWVQFGRDTFPQTTGKPHFLDDHRTCVLPVKLEPGHPYVLWLNKPPYDSFMDSDGRNAVPYLLVFETKR